MKKVRMFVVAGITALVVLPASAASAGRVDQCGTQAPDNMTGATQVPVLTQTFVKADAGGVKYQSTTMYASVGSTGAQAHRYGPTTANEPEPASGVEAKAGSSGVCVAFKAAGGTYKVP